MEAFVAAFFAPKEAGEKEIPESFMADIRRTDERARQTMGESLGEPGGYKDELEIVGNLSVPLAILHGEHEQLVNGAYLNTLSIPTLWREEVQIIHKAGHALHWEKAEPFNALLEAFITETAR